MSVHNEFNNWWARNHPIDWWAKERGGEPLPNIDRLLVRALCERVFAARVDPPAAPTEKGMIEQLADSIAGAINNGALDDRQQRIRTWLIEFATEIQRRAIEP